MPTLAELTKDYAAALVRLRAEEGEARQRIDASLEEAVANRPGGALAIRAYEDALRAAADARDELIHAAHQAREHALLELARKRSLGFDHHVDGLRQARARAESAYERSREGAKRDYDDELQQVDRFLPIETQRALREAARRKYEKKLTEARRAYETAWDDSWADFQARNSDVLADELQGTEEASDTEVEAIAAAEETYERRIRNARTAFMASATTLDAVAVDSYYKARAELGESIERQREEAAAEFRAQKERLANI